MSDEVKTSPKKTKKRSPAYPAINLETAIDRARVLFDEETDAPTNIYVALKHWGYTGQSSPGYRLLSALRQYGLLENEEGSGKDRSVRITQLAKEIILDDRPNSKERADNIKRAALMPTIFQTLWDKYGNATVSDESVAYYLKAKEDFNPKVVNNFIQVWRETFDFANLIEGDILPPDNGNGHEEEPPPPPKPKDRFMQPQTGYLDYTLSLGRGRDIILRAPERMTEEDFEFMTMWLKRLKLVKSEDDKKEEQSEEND
jgi:hypothetical protein